MQAARLHSNSSKMEFDALLELIQTSQLKSGGKPQINAQPVASNIQSMAAPVQLHQQPMSATKSRIAELQQRLTRHDRPPAVPVIHVTAPEPIPDPMAQSNTIVDGFSSGTRSFLSPPQNKNVNQQLVNAGHKSPDRLFFQSPELALVGSQRSQEPTVQLQAKEDAGEIAKLKAQIKDLQSELVAEKNRADMLERELLEERNVNQRMQQQIDWMQEEFNAIQAGCAAQPISMPPMDNMDAPEVSIPPQQNNSKEALYDTRPEVEIPEVGHEQKKQVSYEAPPQPVVQRIQRPQQAQPQQQLLQQQPLPQPSEAQTFSADMESKKPAKKPNLIIAQISGMKSQTRPKQPWEDQSARVPEPSRPSQPVQQLVPIVQPAASQPQPPQQQPQQQQVQQQPQQRQSVATTQFAHPQQQQQIEEPIFCKEGTKVLLLEPDQARECGAKRILSLQDTEQGPFLYWSRNTPQGIEVSGCVALQDLVQIARGEQARELRNKIIAARHMGATESVHEMLASGKLAQIEPAAVVQSRYSFIFLTQQQHFCFDFSADPSAFEELEHILLELGF